CRVYVHCVGCGLGEASLVACRVVQVGVADKSHAYLVIEVFHGGFVSAFVTIEEHFTGFSVGADELGSLCVMVMHRLHLLGLVCRGSALRIVRVRWRGLLLVVRWAS